MSPPSYLSLRLPLLAVRLAAVFALAAPQARAQDPFSEFFGGLFGGGHRAAPHRPAPAGEPRMRRITPQRESRPPSSPSSYWRKTEKPRRAPSSAPSSARRSDEAPAPIAAPAKPAVNPTFFVATLGDTLGITLAGGLTSVLAESFPEHPEVGVISKAKDSSGLVRDDFFDWMKAAREIASAPQKPNVAVVMIGTNDRQPIRRGGESLEPLSDAWKTAYAARVDALIAAFREKNIPVVWVGLPVMRNERFSLDMEVLNEIFRERVTSAGQTYVDLWENLSDEKGQYSAFGPDINGEIVKLRTSDGVYLTEAGGRAVAHFVAGEVKKFFDTGKGTVGSVGPAASAPAPATAAKHEAPAPGKPIVFLPPVSGPATAPALPERPAIGPVQPLGEGAGEAELARRSAAPAPGATNANAAASQALVQHVLVEGGDQPARRNRADDASWPGAPVTTPVPAQPAQAGQK